MFQLIAIIFALGICVGILFMGLSNLNPQMGTKWITATTVDSGVRAFSLAATSYRIANGHLPGASGSGENALSSLVPDYMPPPEAPPGMVWSYGTYSNGQFWVCVSGPVNGGVWAGLKGETSRHSAVATLVASGEGTALSGCGSTENSIPTEGVPPAAAMTISLFKDSSDGKI